MLFLSIVFSAIEIQDTVCESCIEKIAQGDKHALATLYEATKSAVYGFALSIVQNAEDAEDILQTTYVNIYTSAHSYEKKGKPMAWVFTIVRNLSLMLIRKRGKLTDITEDRWNLFPADEKQIPSEDKLVLTAVMKHISPEESQIVMLHAVAGFKHREIASVLQLPLSTVLSKYNRALKKLRTVLEGDGLNEQ